MMAVTQGPGDGMVETLPCSKSNMGGSVRQVHDGQVRYAIVSRFCVQSDFLSLSVLLGEVMKERKSRFILASAKDLLIRRCGPKTLYTACPKNGLTVSGYWLGEGPYMLMTLLRSIVQSRCAPSSRTWGQSVRAEC